METRRHIVPHIPWSCSLVFQPEPRPDEPDLQIHAGFTPDWFAGRMELDYGKRWHTDPVYRHRSFVAMGHVLNRAFPGLRLGGEPDRTIGSLSQIQTCCLMAALFGQEIVYAPDAWPANRAAPLDDAAARALQPPDYRRRWACEDLMRQMDLIEREWGVIEGELNYQGVLNTAFRLRGGQLFADMIEDPPLAHHLLDVVCETMLSVIGEVHARQNRSGARRDYVVTSNCVVNMISESQYREFVMPRDRRLSDRVPLFGVHNCGWNVDAYAQAYSEIRRLAYLDFGMASDLARLKNLFPDSTLAPIFSPVELTEKSPDAIRSDLRRLRERLGRCRIVLADMDARTPTQRVPDFFRIAAEVWDTTPEALVPPPFNDGRDNAGRQPETQPP